MKVAKFAITANSQSGLEMVMEGKKVIVCGDCFYGRKGFTQDLNNASGLGQLVMDTINDPQFSDHELLVRDKFLWGYLNECLWKKDEEYIERRLNTIFSKFNDVRKLDNSKQETFNSFCYETNQKNFPFCTMEISTLSDKLNDSQKRVLIFGTGTIATMLVQNVLTKRDDLHFCSTKLNSTDKFLGYSYLSSHLVEYSEYDLVILTSNLESEAIFKSIISPCLPSNSSTEVYQLKANSSKLRITKLSHNS